MRSYLLIACLLVATVSTPLALAQDVPENGLHRYEIIVSLDPEMHTLTGTQTIDYINDTGAPLSAVYFALIANMGREPNPYLHPALLDARFIYGFDPTWTVIHSVTDAAGEPLPYRLDPSPPAFQTFSLDEGILRVELPAPLAPGERTQIVIEFETRFANARLMDNCIYQGVYIWRFGWNPVAIPPDAVIEERFVFPAADYRVELTVPEDFVVAAGADHHTILDPVDGEQTHILDNDRPTRSVPLVIGRDLEVLTSYAGKIEIETVFLPGAEGPARLAASYAADSLAFFAEHFGPFTHRRLVIVENPAEGFFGMAADGMILVGSSFYRLKDMPVLGMYDRLLDYLVAHEVAHMWWGIGIGADFNAENWISEGFAEFLTFTYFEERYGAFGPNLFAHIGGGLVEDLIRDLLGWFNMRQHQAELAYLSLLHNRFDEAIVKPMRDVEFLNAQFARIYNKGYLVLRALAGRLGDETMFEVLREAHARYDTHILTVDGFQRLAEEVSGTDLSEFFADWIHGTATLDIAVDGFETKGLEAGYETYVYLRRSGEADCCPVVVRGFTAGGEEHDIVWPGGEQEGIVVIHSDEQIVRIHVDPGEMTLDKNRFNNHHPRLIIIDHPMRDPQAPPIGIPLDAYVIELSPTSISGRFRTDHQWSLTFAPHIEPAMMAGEFGRDDHSLTWNLAGRFAVNVDREHTLHAVAMVSAFDPAAWTGRVDLRMTLGVLFFENPQIGSPGTFWYPATALHLSLGARGELPRPTPYIGVGIRHSDLPTSLLENSLMFKIGIPGFGTAPFISAEWGGAVRLRLAPWFYIDVDAEIGSSLFGPLPEQFRLAPERLYAFDRQPAGEHTAFARIEILPPPLARRVGYAIFNLTRIETVSASAFIQGGGAVPWETPISMDSLRVEVGGKITYTMSFLFGMPINLSIGYAVPLLGDGAYPEGMPFFEFGFAF